MKKRILLSFTIAGALLLLFAMLTAAILTIDVQPIGPRQSLVGLSTINEFVRSFFGESMLWYYITDWISVVAIIVPFGFAFLGLTQLIIRKSIRRVDKSVVVLGLFYLCVIASYILFEIFVINYRPIIIYEAPEASYPSSTILVVLCVMSTAMMQFRSLLKKKGVRMAAYIISIIIITVVIIGRLISGVHWFTDILGGLLLGSALVMLYCSVMQFIKYRFK